MKTYFDKKFEYTESSFNALVDYFEEREKNIARANVLPEVMSYFYYVPEDTDFNSSSLGKDYTNAKDIKYGFNKYLQLINLFNRHIIFTPSRENFSAFMGFDTTTYKRLSETSTPEVKAVLSEVEDYIVETTYSASQVGLLKPNITQTRLQTAGVHGNNLVTQKEQFEQDRSERKLKTADEIKRELQALGNTEIKRVNTKE